MNKESKVIIAVLSFFGIIGVMGLVASVTIRSLGIEWGQGILLVEVGLIAGFLSCMAWDQVRRIWKATTSSLYAIWWLSQQDMEQMEHIGGLAELPLYIQQQLRSRYGRAGRGRLWVSDDIPVTLINWNDDVPLTKAAARCGGIVIHARDVYKIAFLPGFVTDTEMKMWEG